MSASRRKIVGALVAVAACAALLAGCGSDAYVPRPNHPTRPAAGAVNQASPAASADPSVAAPTADPAATTPAAGPGVPANSAGFHAVDVPEIGVSVAVRDDMNAFEASAFASGEARQLMDEMAARVGLSHDQLTDAMQRFALLAVAPDGANMNIVRLGLPTVPTAEDVRPTLLQMGMTDLVFEQRTTALGPALSVRGALPVPTKGAGTWAYEENLWAVSGSHGLFSLTVTTMDNRSLDPLFESVLASLEPLA